MTQMTIKLIIEIDASPLTWSKFNMWKQMLSSRLLGIRIPGPNVGFYAQSHGKLAKDILILSSSITSQTAAGQLRSHHTIERVVDTKNLPFSLDTTLETHSREKEISLKERVETILYLLRRAPIQTDSSW
jgi:hypothetical protein